MRIRVTRNAVIKVVVNVTVVCFALGWFIVEPARNILAMPMSYVDLLAFDGWMLPYILALFLARGDVERLQSLAK